MAIIWLLPKLTKAVPASLVAILLVSGHRDRDQPVRSPSDLPPPGQPNVVMTVGDML